MSLARIIFWGGLLLILLFICCSYYGCARYEAETQRQLAEAHIMDAQALVLQECRRMMQLQQAGPCPQVVSITIARKYGEVPQISMVPPLSALPVIGGVLGGTQ